MKKAILFSLTLLNILFANTYLSQEYIDSTVQEAYYGFVSSSREAGGLHTQSAAINTAQDVVNRLKKLAENDPNRRYILWRVSELQQQIYLEQEEVSLKQEYERVTEINRLVAIFNEELFLPRPSFAKLHTLHSQVSAISIDHANQFARNINQKNRVVLNELRSEITDLFNRGDYDGVEKLYKYAIKNKKHLHLDEDVYEEWSTRIQAKRNADYLKENIGKQVNYLSGMVQKNKIAEARRHVDVIQKEIEGAARHLSSSFVNKTNSQLGHISKSITNREDSLVDYNLSLISEHKSDKATYYMEQVLRPAGVDPEKVANVDRAILKAGGTTKKENKKVNAEIAAISANTASPIVSMDKINSQVKIKADSLRRYYAQLQTDVRDHYISENKSEFKKMAKEEAKKEKLRIKADNIVIKADTQRRQGKTNAADKTLAKKEEFLLSYATPSLYIDARRDLNRELGRNTYGDRQIAAISKRQAEFSPEKMQEKAINITTQIYTALDSKNIEGAAGLFYRNESLLEKNSYKDAFHTLKRTIVREYSRKYLK